MHEPQIYYFFTNTKCLNHGLSAYFLAGKITLLTNYSKKTLLLCCTYRPHTTRNGRQVRYNAAY